MLGASALALTAGAAKAQTQTMPPPAASAAVNEVVVTATRREAANIMQVPLAVDAYSGKTLQRLGIFSETALSTIDPSLDIQSYGPVEEKIIIRGISSESGATTGVYYDETPLEGGFYVNINGDNLPTLGVRDISDVEVLKGPQGTLFGAGSMDGTVRIVTNQPNLETYGGSVEADYGAVQGGDGLFDGSATLNVPIVKDALGLRVTVWGNDGGGYIDQTLPDGQVLDHVNDTQLYGLRAEVLWKPIENLTVLGTASYQSSHVNGQQGWSPYVAGDMYPYSPFVGPYPAYENRDVVQTPYWQQFQLYSVTVKYDLGFGQIIANSAYGNKVELATEDTSPQDCAYDLCTGFGFPPAMYSSQMNFWYQENEIRFASNFKGPVQLVAGVYNEHDHSVYNGTVINANPATGVVPCLTWNQCLADGLVQPGNNLTPGVTPSNAVQYADTIRQTVDQEAFYAQADWKILPNLTATAGIRYYLANIEYSEIDDQDIAPPSPTDFCSYVTACVTRPYLLAKQPGKEGQPTYNFALLWAVTPDLSLYARAASGFRIGGVNEATEIAEETGIHIPATFGPDTLWDYEGGFKAYFLDRKLFLDVGGFHIDWSNEQQFGVAYGVYDYTLNVGSTAVNGMELNTTYRPIPDLTFSGGFTYIVAELGSNLPPDVVDAGTPGVIGDPVPFVPRWIGTAQAEYDRRLTDQFLAYLQGDFTYHGSSFSAFQAVPANAAPGLQSYDTELPAYFLLDLKAGVRWARYDVSIFARNVTNTVAWMGASPSDGGLQVWSATPRTIGLMVSANF